MLLRWINTKVNSVVDILWYLNRWAISALDSQISQDASLRYLPTDIRADSTSRGASSTHSQGHREVSSVVLSRDKPILGATSSFSDHGKHEQEHKQYAFIL